MSKISELSDGGSLVSSDYLIAVRSGGNVKVRMNQINVDQVDLGDNEFIRLGNSQDLTMVHTSTQSIINQAGIGDLLIQKAGSTKLTINASGIDVTGSVTADGLTVDGDITVNDATPSLTLSDTGGTNQKFVVSHNGATSYLTFRNGTNYGALQFLADNGTTTATRQSISSNGDISFYNTAGTSQSLFWDASAEALGIGTTSPVTPLTVGDFGDTARAATFHGGSIKLDGGAVSEIIIGDGNVAYMSIQTTDNATAMKIRDHSGNADLVTVERATGNVGIGRSSALIGTYLSKSFVYDAGGANFALGGLSNTNNAVLSRFTSFNVANSNSGNESSANFYGVTSIESIVVTTDSNAGADSGGSLLFKTKPEAGVLTERMRIDASGNLLVGGTSTNPTGQNVAGAAIDSSGEGNFSVDGAEALRLNRKTSDGTIVSFMKDGTTVGSITSRTGATLGLILNVTSGVGAGLSATSNAIFPIDETTTPVNNQISLGTEGFAFKDLRLSGGVVFGATGGAVTSKTLDDYEEGTFTPVLAAHSGTSPTIGGTNYGSYTKVGRLVSVIIELNVTSISGVTSNYITCSLPISAVSGAGYFSQGSQTNSSVSWARPENVGPTLYGADKFGFLSSDNAGGGWGWEGFGAFSGNEIMRISFSYFAA